MRPIGGQGRPPPLDPPGATYPEFATPLLGKGLIHTYRGEVLSFTPFDRRQPLKQTWRRLPHWDQPGATYFVTFRLADALPVEAQARFAELRELSGASAFAETDRWLDAGKGHCLLSHPQNTAMMAETLRYFDGRRYQLGAYVIMPNHVHALVQPLNTESLTHVLHRWKSYSARKLQEASGVMGTVWQDERFDRIGRNEYELRAFHDYILGNPARRG